MKLYLKIFYIYLKLKSFLIGILQSFLHTLFSYLPKKRDIIALFDIGGYSFQYKKYLRKLKNNSRNLNFNIKGLL